MWDGKWKAEKAEGRGMTEDACIRVLKAEKEEDPTEQGLLHPHFVWNFSYQFTFSANWKVRGSWAALGWPALQLPEIGSQSGLTSLTLNRLSMLKPSAITSRFMRSPIANLRASRRSIWKKPGRVKALRARFPTQPKGGDGTVRLGGKG